MSLKLHHDESISLFKSVLFPHSSSTDHSGTEQKSSKETVGLMI